MLSSACFGAYWREAFLFFNKHQKHIFSPSVFEEEQKTKKK